MKCWNARRNKLNNMKMNESSKSKVKIMTISSADVERGIREAYSEVQAHLKGWMDLPQAKDITF